MKRNLKYRVTIIGQIPYLTKILGAIVSVCFIICILVWLLYFPSTNSGNEMKTVALISSTPKTTKWFLMCCFIGIIPLYFLYVKIRSRKSAFLLFNDTDIAFQYKNLMKTIPIAYIRNIQFSEPNLSSNIFSQKLVISIKLYDNETINFNVQYYEDADKIIEDFFSYPELSNRVKEGANSLLESDIDS